MTVIGAVMAGGLSSRYGAPKALEQIGGRRVIDRVVHALHDAGIGHVVAIVNDAALAAAIGLPHRADVLRDVGALAGVHAALLWARELSAEGIIAAACDMPFLEAALVRELIARRTAVDAVLPESEGPRGVEPLCAYYGVGCIEAIERAAARGDSRMIGFHADVAVERVPLDVVRSVGDPALLFRNMNTPADREEAERILGGRA